VDDCSSNVNDGTSGEDSKENPRCFADSEDCDHRDEKDGRNDDEGLHSGVWVCVKRGLDPLVSDSAGESSPVEIRVANMNDITTSVLNEPIRNESNASELVGWLFNPARSLEAIDLSRCCFCFHRSFVVVPAAAD